MSAARVDQPQDSPESSGPVLAKVAVFSLGLALLFTLVANTLPQIEGEAPVDQEVDLGALTMDSFVALGESIFNGKGTCALCHNNLGRAPDLLAENVVETAAQRIEDSTYEGGATDVEEYLRESMLSPGAYVVKGFGKKGTNDTESPMPGVDKPPIQLSVAEMDAVIAFMQAKDGNSVTVALPVDAPVAESESADSASSAPPAADTPEAVVAKYGCAACHTMLGSESPVGPRLDDVGSRLSSEKIRESVIDPAADIAEGFTPIMPAIFADQMSIRELEMLVKFLAASK